MWNNRYLMMFLILLLTLGAVVVCLLLGGQEAVTTVVGVVGLILTILRWFFPISPEQHGSPGSGPQEKKLFEYRSLSSSKRFSGGSFKKR
jgi:hypothetical protein